MRDTMAAASTAYSRIQAPLQDREQKCEEQQTVVSHSRMR
jgi:predicted RNase H-like nuclease (RuvC/YqgF family)